MENDRNSRHKQQKEMHIFLRELDEVLMSPFSIAGSIPELSRIELSGTSISITSRGKARAMTEV